MTTTAEFEWTDSYLVGFEPIDDTHREFVVLVEAMLAADDQAMAACVTAFEQHAEAHFDLEARLMRETHFPAMDCHVDEHDRVLKSTREVRELVVKGDAAVARRFAAQLVKWFPAHADYLDSALAQWVVKKRCGGVPIVLKRDLACAA